jgi:hypothetical protein
VPPARSVVPGRGKIERVERRNREDRSDMSGVWERQRDKDRGGLGRGTEKMEMKNYSNE